MFAEVKKAYGRLAILANNAGVYGVSSIETITDETFWRYLQNQCAWYDPQHPGGYKTFGDESPRS